MSGNNAPTFTEAPASATMKIDYKGYDVLFTLRAGTGAELLDKLSKAVDYFESHNISPAANGHAKPTPAGDAPLCPAHNKPMKQSQRGGWYCPVKLLEDGGDGKPVYCKQKVGQ
jgi:hypothetical protein